MHKQQPSIEKPIESLPGCPPQIGKKCCVYRNEDDSCQSLRYDCVDRNQVCPDRIDCWVKIKEAEVSDCRCCGEITKEQKKINLFNLFKTKRHN